MPRTTRVKLYKYNELPTQGKINAIEGMNLEYKILLSQLHTTELNSTEWEKATKNLDEIITRKGMVPDNWEFTQDGKRF